MEETRKSQYDELKTGVALPGKKPPPIFSRLVELLADVNLSMDEVDMKIMEEFPQLKEEGWAIGSTRKKVKKYPSLARTAAEARMLLWREVGKSKIDGYKVYADAVEADKVAPNGDAVPDHDIRIKGADRMLALMGENVNPNGARINVNLPGDNAKIMIMTSEGSPLPFPSREEIKDGD